MKIVLFAANARRAEGNIVYSMRKYFIMNDLKLRYTNADYIIFFCL